MNNAHFHVIAVQDWGGSQERWKACTGKLTIEDARQLADDAIRADAPNRPGFDWNQYDALRKEFGDRYPRLVSSSVAPGWEAVWIAECSDPCRSRKEFQRICDEEGWGEPYWAIEQDALYCRWCGWSENEYAKYQYETKVLLGHDCEEVRNRIDRTERRRHLEIVK